VSGIDNDKIQIQLVGQQKSKKSSTVVELPADVSSSFNVEPTVTPKPVNIPLDNQTLSSKQEVIPNVPKQHQADYITHLIECNCFIRQFKNSTNPPSHKFIVFSELDESANVKPSYAKCNNCGAVRRITEICVSQAAPSMNEDSRSLETIDDIRLELPQNLIKILEKHECELHTWQEARFILKAGLFGRFVVLSKERTKEDLVIGKTCQILGNDLYKIENFERDERGISF
jgi:hypothetical protein